jgi:hypothetical protein
MWIVTVLFALVLCARDLINYFPTQPRRFLLVWGIAWLVLLGGAR